MLLHLLLSFQQWHERVNLLLTSALSFRILFLLLIQESFVNA